MTAAVPVWATGEWQQISQAVLQPPGKAFQPSTPSNDQLQAMRQQMLQSIWQAFLEIVDGFLDPTGQPSDQLASWSTDIQAVATDFQDLIDDVTGLNGGSWADLGSTLTTTGNDLNTLATDIFGTNSTSGWTTLLDDIIPGLDASKIVSGQFSISAMPPDVQNVVTDFQNLIDDVTGVNGGSWSQLGSELTTTSTDLGTLATDLFGSNSSAEWTSILNAIIPGLDASKITTGVFAVSQIPTISQTQVASLETDLDALFPSASWATFANGLVSGGATDINSLVTYINGIGSAATTAFTTGNFNPLLSALFGTTSVQSAVSAAAVPGLDASKIVSGSLSLSSITAPVTSWWNSVLAALGLSGVSSTSSFSTWLTNVDTAAFNAVTTGNYNGLLSALFGSTTVGTAVQPSAVPGIDASKIITGSISNAFLPGVNSLINTLFGSGTIGAQIVAAIVPGIGGQSNAASSIQSTIDNFINGLNGTTGSGYSFGQAANAAASTQAAATHAATAANAAAATQAAQAFSKQTTSDGTTDWPIDPRSYPTPPTYIQITSANSAMDLIQIQDNVNKLAIKLWGYYSGTVTGVYFNVYQINKATGAAINVYQSANQVSAFGTVAGPDLAYINFNTPITVSPGQSYWVEVYIVGSGTLYVVGTPNHWMPTDIAGVYPPMIGGTRTTGTIVPTFDATGTSGQSGSGTSFTWSHNLGAALATTGCIEVDFVAGSTAPTSVKFGSATLSLIKSASPNSSAYTQYKYGLIGTPSAPLPTGPQNVVVTFSASQPYFTGDSTSHNNVASFGTPATALGSGTSMSIAVPSGANQLVVVTFAAQNTISGYSGTQRYNVAGSLWRVASGDSAGAATTTVTATLAASANWGAIGVPLIGPPAPNPTTIAAPGPATSSNIPCMGLSAVGGKSTPQYTPVTYEQQNPGTATWTPPSWLVAGMFIDLIGIGAGGGGANNAGFYGGQCGVWGTATLTVGATGANGIGVGQSITATVGYGGSNPYPTVGPGTNGAATTFTWKDAAGTTQTLTCAGGIGASNSGYTWGSGYGQGATPSPITYPASGATSQPYYGGTTVAQNSPGSAPGGGAGGSGEGAYAGAYGCAWGMARAS